MMAATIKAARQLRKKMMRMATTKIAPKIMFSVTVWTVWLIKLVRS